ncbi:arf-GAP with coiled-coil, ANK repeat and PH domain-containing protein 1-like, partial [Clarias magur]
MTIKDFEDCLKDSPRFRSTIEGVEGDVNELESRLEKLVKQCNAMLDAGRTYCVSSKNFVSGIRELGYHFPEDTTVRKCLETFSKKLSTILNAQEDVSPCSLTVFFPSVSSSFSCQDLIESTQRTVKQKLQSFVKEDVKRFKDARKEFERSSETLEAALGRNAQAPRGKTHEVDEASHALTQARKAFRSGTLDYVLQINVIESKKKTDIVMSMISLMETQAAFFQQGHQSLAELEEYRKQLSDEYTQLVLNSAREKRDMEQRHCDIKKKDESYDESILDFSPDTNSGIAMEGYLYKRASNAFKTWSRRWFSIQKNQLVYQKKFKRERCSSMSSSLNPSVERKDYKALEEVQSIPGNNQCCDCGEPGPDWASINLGITLCITCSGIHRSLGVHFSKVRSLTLDSWEPELIKLMCELGNTAINRIYEARIDEITIKKPHPSSPRLVCLFLKRGADYNKKDISQKDPITIAVESANADIVTLLRIAKMNKEMREMDGFAQS